MGKSTLGSPHASPFVRLGRSGERLVATAAASAGAGGRPQDAHMKMRRHQGILLPPLLVREKPGTDSGWTLAWRPCCGWGRLPVSVNECLELPASKIGMPSRRLPQGQDDACVRALPAPAGFSHWPGSLRSARSLRETPCIRRDFGGRDPGGGVPAFGLRIPCGSLSLVRGEVLRRTGRTTGLKASVPCSTALE